jgi:hypothetical protein
LPIAGKDATEAFFSLHRYEVLEKPQYQRLQIGVINGEKSVIHARIPGELSKVPYAEPTWLTEGYHSPYYSEVYDFVDTLVPRYLAYIFFSHRATGSSKRPSVNSLTMLFYLMPL